MALLKKPAPSPEAVAQAARANLADAIGQLDVSKAEHATALLAKDALENKVQVARRVRWSADANLEEARQNAVAYETAQARGQDDFVPPQTVREARNLLTDAEDAEQAAEAALKAVEGDTRPPSDFRVKRALRDVLQSEAAATLAVANEVTRLQRELLRYGEALEVLVQAAAFPTIADADHTMPIDQAISRAHNRMSLAPSMWQDIRSPSDIAGAWRGSISELAKDATIPLPVHMTPKAK